MPEIQIEAQKVRYAEAGEGESTILFVHGWACDERIWSLNMATLPKGYRALAPCLFAPDRPVGGYTVDGFSKMLSGLLRALGISKATFVGHSLGGVVCQNMALKYPDQVERMVLVATGATVKGHGRMQPVLERMRSEGKNRDTMTSMTKYWFVKPPPEDVFDACVDAAMAWPLDALIEGLITLFDTDLESRLPEITAPTLIIHGALDTGRKVEHAEMLCNGIRGSRLVVFPDCGHSPNVEDPVAFNRTLFSFLSEA